MEEQIKNFNKYVNEYYSCALSDGVRLNTLLQKLTAILEYLSQEKAKYKLEYEKTVFNLVREGSSVARAINEAEVKHPELYLLRQIVTSGYRVADAIRTNISFLKSEMSHLKQH